MSKMLQQSKELVIVWLTGLVHYMMQLFEKEPETLLVYVNIGVGLTIIVFTLTRIYFWIKNEGSSKND